MESGELNFTTRSDHTDPPEVFAVWFFSNTSKGLHVRFEVVIFAEQSIVVSAEGMVLEVEHPHSVRLGLYNHVQTCLYGWRGRRFESMDAVHASLMEFRLRESAWIWG